MQPIRSNQINITMRKSIITLAFGLASFASYSQTKVALDNSGDYVAVAMPSKSAYEPTGAYFKNREGERLPIYSTKSGKEFVLCTSKKTGKEYRKYIAR